MVQYRMVSNRHCLQQKDLEDSVRLLQELLCLLSSQRVKRLKQTKMPQGLPTSDSLPLHPPASVVHTIACCSGPASTSSTVVFSKEAASSFCETLISSAQGSQHYMHGDQSVPQTINLVVSSANSAPVNVAQISTNTTTVMSSQYHLREIVEQEKNRLFQSQSDMDIELEPPRQHVATVRRRSRQFFPLMEEENSDDEAIVPKFGETHSKPQVKPILNLGDSFKRLYFPNKRQMGKRTLGVYEDMECSDSVSSVDSRSGKESDSNSEGMHALVSGLRRNKSHPELNTVEPLPVSFPDDYHFCKTKSLPNTPKVSPKLQRRNSLSKENKEVAKTGPGFSFLAHVAGELHRNKIRNDKKLEQGVVKMPEKMDITPMRQMQTTSTSVTSSYTQPVTTAVASKAVHDESDTLDSHGRHFTDFASLDEIQSHAPTFVKNIFEWSTQKKVKVNKKEANMWAPQSF